MPMLGNKALLTPLGKSISILFPRVDKEQGKPRNSKKMPRSRWRKTLELRYTMLEGLARSSARYDGDFTAGSPWDWTFFFFWETQLCGRGRWGRWEGEDKRQSMRIEIRGQQRRQHARTEDEKKRKRKGKEHFASRVHGLFFPHLFFSFSFSYLFMQN